MVVIGAKRCEVIVPESKKALKNLNLKNVPAITNAYIEGEVEGDKVANPLSGA